MTAPRSLLAPVAIALRRGGFTRPRSWASAVVVLRHGEAPRAALRGDFAGWLLSNGLAASARECTRRKVLPGHVLVWLEIDVEEVSGARFVLFNFEAALRAATVGS